MYCAGSLGPAAYSWCGLGSFRGCYKVNTNGSHSMEGSSAYGGLIQQSNGSFLHRFTCRLGAGNALWAELWDVCLGMHLARQLGLS